ncbi:MAG TPA: MFS transporter, partial [Micromonosporaceae bacterium]
EAEQLRNEPSTRDAVFARKATDWMKVAEQIRSEDPEAYEYLTGTKGMERIGAGFIAALASIMFAMFDFTASLLVLLGFLIFRWAVIAAPVLGTVGLLRPASAGFRRLLNAVVAALFNIVIFGTGAAIYLFAVDLIMNTRTLPGWLQVVLVWLCGVVGWLLLRPYRRITQLGGGRDPSAAVASAGSWHRRFFRDLRESVPAGAAKAPAGAEGGSNRPPSRVEVRAESSMLPDRPPEPAAAPVPPPRRRMPEPAEGGWTEPETTAPGGYTLYRPRRSSITLTEGGAPARSTARAEARRDA